MGSNRIFHMPITPDFGAFLAQKVELGVELQTSCSKTFGQLEQTKG